MKIAIVFYSMYGHMYRMAKAAEEGARSRSAEVRLLRIAETLSTEILSAAHALDTQNILAGLAIATPDDLEWADGIIFGVPTRFGNVPSQVAAFLDSTGQVWQRGGLVGKVGSVMSSGATRHGGSVTTIQHMQISLLAHGMVIAGLPYSKDHSLFDIGEVNGGSVFGATTIVGSNGDRQPSKHELGAAKAQGAWIAELAGRLAAR